MKSAHDSNVAGQFGPRAKAYVESAVHSQGADLARIADIAAAARPARAIDLGCGGGHVTYAMAPHARETVACDLSADMLSAVRATARPWFPPEAVTMPAFSCSAGVASKRFMAPRALKDPVT